MIAGSKVPKAFKKQIGMSFSNSTALDNISCEEQALVLWITDFIAELAKTLTCILAENYRCEISPSNVVVTKCVSGARKKRAAEKDVVLEFTLPLDDQAQQDLQGLV